MRGRVIDWKGERRSRKRRNFSVAVNEERAMVMERPTNNNITRIVSNERGPRCLARMRQLSSTPLSAICGVVGRGRTVLYILPGVTMEKMPAVAVKSQSAGRPVQHASYTCLLNSHHTSLWESWLTWSAHGSSPRSYCIFESDDGMQTPLIALIKQCTEAQKSIDRYQIPNPKPRLMAQNRQCGTPENGPIVITVQASIASI